MRSNILSTYYQHPIVKFKAQVPDAYYIKQNSLEIHELTITDASDSKQTVFYDNIDSVSYEKFHPIKDFKRLLFRKVVGNYRDVYLKTGSVTITLKDVKDGRKFADELNSRIEDFYNRKYE